MAPQHNLVVGQQLAIVSKAASKVSTNNAQSMN